VFKSIYKTKRNHLSFYQVKYDNRQRDNLAFCELRYRYENTKNVRIHFYETRMLIVYEYNRIFLTISHTTIVQHTKFHLCDRFVKPGWQFPNAMLLSSYSNSFNSEFPCFIMQNYCHLLIYGISRYDVFFFLDVFSIYYIIIFRKNSSD